MAAALDMKVSTALARLVRNAAGLPDGAMSGQAFERRLFRALEGLDEWEHSVGPDHFDMALDLVGRTGTHYEFDGAFLSAGTLYVVEAKKVALLARQHVGIFVHKLVDTLLAPRDDWATLAIKPVLVSAGPRISSAAWLYAASWGVLLVSPQRPTPHEILDTLASRPNSAGVTQLRSECEELARQLWRPFDRIVFPSRPNSVLYQIATDQILNHDTCHHLIEEWDACIARAPLNVSVAP